MKKNQYKKTQLDAITNLNNLCTHLNQLDALADPDLNPFFQYILEDKGGENYAGGLSGIREIYSLPTALPQATPGRQAINNYQNRFLAQRERFEQTPFSNNVKTAFANQREKIDNIISDQENLIKGVGLEILDLIRRILNDFADNNFYVLNEQFNILRFLLIQQTNLIERLLDTLEAVAKEIEKNFEEIKTHLNDLHEKFQKLCPHACEATCSHSFASSFASKG